MLPSKVAVVTGAVSTPNFSYRLTQHPEFSTKAQSSIVLNCNQLLTLRLILHLESRYRPRNLPEPRRHHENAPGSLCHYTHRHRPGSTTHQRRSLQQI